MLTNQTPSGTADRDFDVCIIGAGVVGLAIGARLAPHCRVLVVERNNHWGSETSSRNSEVIHAGLYYPANSLKEKLCLRGKHMLYQYCRERHIPHQSIGKLVVSQSEDHPSLLSLADNACRLGIDHQLLDRQQLQRRQPGITAQAALWSPGTGIIDSHRLMQSLLADITNHQGMLVEHTRFEQAWQHSHGWTLQLSTPDGPCEIRTLRLVNAAGLCALRVMQACEGVDIPNGLALSPARGNYFSYQGKHPFRHLVYPIPEPGLAGLGIHATLDLTGQLKFGPDVEWLETPAEATADTIKPQLYQVNATRHPEFITAIQHYWPDIDASRLVPGYAGVRPKLSGPNQAPVDFQIHQPPGAANTIHLLGIESPGLTAALAIAEQVEEVLAAG